MVKTLEYWLAHFILWSVALCPPLARVYVKALDMAIPRWRRAAIRNLEIAGFTDAGADPKLIDRDLIIDGMYRSIARMLATFAKFPSMNRENIGQWIRYDGLDNFQNALARGRVPALARSENYRGRRSESTAQCSRGSSTGISRTSRASARWTDTSRQ